MERVSGDNLSPADYLEAELKAAGVWPTDERMAELLQKRDEIIRRGDIGDQLRAGLNETPATEVAFPAEARLVRAIADAAFNLNPVFLERVVGFARELTQEMKQQSPQGSSQP